MLIFVYGNNNKRDMETTFNNIFKNALNNAVEEKNRIDYEKAEALKIFLDDMNHIKKNLESAFIGTPIRVEMGMFGVPNPVFTTIRICWSKGNISSICANSCPSHYGGWVNTTYEKDIRVGGKPMTYDELFDRVAVKYAESL